MFNWNVWPFHTTGMIKWRTACHAQAFAGFCLNNVTQARLDLGPSCPIFLAVLGLSVKNYQHVFWYQNMLVCLCLLHEKEEHFPLPNHLVTGPLNSVLLLLLAGLCHSLHWPGRGVPACFAPGRRWWWWGWWWFWSPNCWHWWNWTVPDAKDMGVQVSCTLSSQWNA